MSIHFRGDPERVSWIHERPDGQLEVWMASDGPNVAPIITTRDRLVATDGAREIDDTITRMNTVDRQRKAGEQA